MCASAWLSVLGGSFISFLITNAIGSSEMLALQKDRKRLKCNETKYTHSSCHLICYPVTDCTISQVGERRRTEQGKESPREVFYFVFFLFFAKKSYLSHPDVHYMVSQEEKKSEVLEMDYQKHPAVHHTFTFISVHSHTHRHNNKNKNMMPQRHAWPTHSQSSMRHTHEVSRKKWNLNRWDG